MEEYGASLTNAAKGVLQEMVLSGQRLVAPGAKRQKETGLGVLSVLSSRYAQEV